MRTAALVFAALAIATTTASAQGNGEAGARATTSIGRRMEPSSATCRGTAPSRCSLSEPTGRWVSASTAYYDMETPVDVTGVRSADAKPVDAFINVYRFRADVRRHFRQGRRWEPYVEAGLGVYMANSDEPAGVTADGGVYRLTVDTPATAALNLSAGGNIRVAGPVKINLALSYGRAFRQYRVTDVVSGRSGPVRPLSPLGPSIGLVFGF